MAYGLLFDYLNGQCIEAYKYFGAHFETREVKEIITIPLKKDPNKTKKSSRKKLIEGVVFRLYAPAASDVSVIGDWNGYYSPRTPGPHGDLLRVTSIYLWIRLKPSSIANSRIKANHLGKYFLIFLILE